MTGGGRRVDPQQEQREQERRVREYEAKVNQITASRAEFREVLGASSNEMRFYDIYVSIIREIAKQDYGSAARLKEHLHRELTWQDDPTRLHYLEDVQHTSRYSASLALFVSMNYRCLGELPQSERRNLYLQLSEVPPNLLQQRASTIITGVDLETLVRELTFFAQAISGVSVTVKSGESGFGSYFDGKQIIIAPTLTTKNPAQTYSFYKVAAAHQAGHIEFGTFNLNPKNIDEARSRLKKDG